MNFDHSYQDVLEALVRSNQFQVRFQFAYHCHAKVPGYVQVTHGALLFDHTIMEGRAPFTAATCDTIYFIGYLEDLESHLQCGIYPGKDWRDGQQETLFLAVHPDI